MEVLLALVAIVGPVLVTGAQTAPYSAIATAQDSYALPDLPYDYPGLEPYVDSATLVNHHTGHHAAYTNNLNKFLKQWRQEEPDNELAKSSIVHILQNLNKVTERFRTPIRNHGGGFVNHAIYWACMSPNSDNSEREPQGKLLADIVKTFGSYDKFKEAFNTQAKTLFGSGYVWLSRNLEKNGELVLSTTVNQESPLTEGLVPVLVLDVWEHAYYLKHQYKRPDYIQDWWHVVDWDNVQKLDRWWKDVETRDEL